MTEGGKAMMLAVLLSSLSRACSPKYSPVFSVRISSSTPSAEGRDVLREPMGRSGKAGAYLGGHKVTFPLGMSNVPSVQWWDGNNDAGSD